MDFLARDFGGYLKLPCILWCHDLINGVKHKSHKNDKYGLFLPHNRDIVVKSIVNILVQRHRIDKLEEFLNYAGWSKNSVSKEILGSAYSNLFDGLYKMRKYDNILEHFEKAVQLIDEEHFNQSILNKLKLGSDDFNRKFRLILWQCYAK